MDEIVIIGANGFVGGHLCNALLQTGAAVHGYDLPETHAIVHDRFQYHQLDVLSDPVQLPESCSTLIYLSQAPGYRQFPRKIQDLFGVNAWGPSRVAEAFMKTKGRLFLYASTGSVYAPSFAPMNESSETNRDNAYALSKLGGEDLIELLDANIPDMRFVSLRFFSLFGPQQRAMLPVTLFRRVLGDEPIILQPSPADPADKDGLRVSWLYIHDLTRILTSMLTLQIAPEKIPARLNVAGRQAMSIREYAEYIGKFLGKRLRWKITANPRPFDLIADTTRMQELCSPVFTCFADAVEETVRELRTMVKVKQTPSREDITIP